MPRDWQRIVFDNSPIYVKADAKGNQLSTLRTFKNFLRHSPTCREIKKSLKLMIYTWNTRNVVITDVTEAAVKTKPTFFSSSG